MPQVEYGAPPEYASDNLKNNDTSKKKKTVVIRTFEKLLCEKDEFFLV